MNYHPNRILNIALYNEYLNLLIQNYKSARANGDHAVYDQFFRRFARLTQFMGRYHFYPSGGDAAGERFHFAYWG